MLLHMRPELHGTAPAPLEDFPPRELIPLDLVHFDELTCSLRQTRLAYVRDSAS